MDSGPASRIGKTTVVAVVGLASFCVLVPWFHFGIPSGHDFEFHMNSWIEVLAHWKQGIVYPHWAALAHYGYGEARFIFYPPASWNLGAGLGAILPWKLVPAAFVWLALTLAGLSMFVLARQYLSPGSALFAAIWYALNPYHLIIVYWRSAFAELLAAAYLPLLFLCVLKLEQNGKRMIAPIAVLLAVGWLTNVPSAVMMHYFLAILALWTAISGRRWNVLMYAGIAVIAGAGLAAVYLLPVWFQRGWVSLDQVLSPGVRPQDNFLFEHTTDADHDRFNLLVSAIAVSEFAVLGIILLFWRAKRATQLWWPLLVCGGFCAFIMLPLTSGLWSHLPQLRYVQFPWRWLLVFNVALAFASAIALRTAWLRGAVFLLALFPVLIGAQRILPPWWDRAADVQEMLDNQQDGVGNEGTDEYAPAGPDPYEVDQNAPLAGYSGAVPAKVAIQRWDAERRVVTADASSAARIALRLFSYPQWRVRIDGRPDYAETGSHGELLVPIQGGVHQIEVTWAAEWDRRIGAAVSLLALIALLFWHTRSKKTSDVGRVAG